MTVTSISASRVQSAIAYASNRTGVDFDYLLGQAKLESGLRADARAGTSSASGLYQFIEQSWLAVVKKHGAEHGMAWAADSIGQTAGGRYTVGDRGTRNAILALRNDPAAASLMAAAHASDNKQAIEGQLGREANGTDLYMAHFLGIGGAKKFLAAMQSNPDATGAGMFPSAAGANRSVFYAADGSARSLSQIYDRFAAKLGSATSDTVGETAAANNAQAMRYTAQALEIDGSTVVNGTGESADDALSWATAAMGRFTPNGSRVSVNALLRPTPDTARLAYMMLAGMGGRS